MKNQDIAPAGDCWGSLKRNLLSRGYGVGRAATLLGVTRPYLSNVLGGKVSGVSSRIIRGLCALANAHEQEAELLYRYGKGSDLVQQLGALDRNEAPTAVTWWIVLRRFASNYDDSVLARLHQCLAAGQSFVLWSTAPAELQKVVQRLQSHGATEQLLRDRLTCVMGPDWLELASWRLKLSLERRELWKLETIRGRPINGRWADWYLADPLLRILSGPWHALTVNRAESYKDRQNGGTFTLVHPKKDDLRTRRE